MLAYRGALPTSYEPVATLGSLLIAIGLATCGFALATRCGRWCFALGGAVIGIAIGVTHYVGMHALIVPGSLSWDASLIVFSLVIGVAMSAAAMMVFHLKTGLGAIVAAGSLLTLAICGLHFAAMGAVTVVPDPTLAFQGYGINRSYMALSVAGVTFVVLLTALAAAAIQRANIRCESVLREQNSLFESALHHLPVGLSMFDGEQRLIMCNPAYRRLYDLSEELACAGASFSDIVLNYVRREGGDDERIRLDGARNWITEHLSKFKLGNIFTETVLGVRGESETGSASGGQAFRYGPQCNPLQTGRIALTFVYGSHYSLSHCGARGDGVKRFDGEQGSIFYPCLVKCVGHHPEGLRIIRRHGKHPRAARRRARQMSAWSWMEKGVAHLFSVTGDQHDP